MRIRKIKNKIVDLLVLLLAVFFVACSDDSGSGTGASFTSEEDDPSSYIAEKIVPIKNKTISGYAQKGPFKAGSTVDIYELELDGKTFAQTGKSFTGKVANDKGEFKIPNVSLKSQYALLKVTGYFTSEINGEGVRATLTAVTDLSKRESVNVNILTHLEYDRVLALLGKGMNFTSAKKQAGREVLAAFGIGLEENAAAEDLDVSGESDADAALVAISKLVLAGEESGTNRDEEDLSRSLAIIAGSIGENGDFMGKKGLARRIQRWSGRECSLPYDTYDKEGKYLYQFYISWLFIGKYCTSLLDGVGVDVDVDDTTESVNSWELSDYRFFCKDGEWRYVGGRGWTEYFDNMYVISKKSVVSSQWCDDATDKELSNFGVGRDGEIKVGNITGTSYKYDEIESKWLEINVLDTLLAFVCTEKHYGEFAKDNNTAYYCGHFRTGGEQDMYCNSMSELAWGPVLECNQKAYWRRATNDESDLGVVCSENELGKIVKGKNGLSYKCIISGIWTELRVLDTLLFVCGVFPETLNDCVDSVIDNKKMFFQCLPTSGMWYVFMVADDAVSSLQESCRNTADYTADSSAWLICEAADELEDSLYLELNNYGIPYPGVGSVVSDSSFDASFSSRPRCSALRDSLQLKQNSP